MLAEADFATTQRAMEGRSADDRLMIKFELFPHPNQEKSLAAGHPVFDDKEYITIIVPGDKTSVIHRPVWEQDLQRFPRQYAQFKQGLEQTVSGLPLKLWGGMSLGQAKEYEYFNVRTVEQLAEMADGHGGNIQGFQAMKQKARDYVAATKEQAPLLQLRAELETKDSEVASLQQALADQGARIAQLERLIPKSKLAALEAEDA
jgi:hypothetical protein